MSRRLIYVGLLVVLLIPFGGDWVLATARLPNIDIQGTLDVPGVVADGKSAGQITVRVTENGSPRANDVLQTWIETGGGLLVPQWVYTDENGEATIKFSPNPQTKYDTVDVAQIHIRDTSIGRLIEVGKDTTVDVPLTAPTDEKKGSILG